MPILFSLIGLSVIAICIFLFWKTGSAWFNRKFGEALVQDIRDVREAQSSESKDSEG
jgi:hypothetical protein